MKFESLTTSLETYFDLPTAKLNSWLKNYPSKKPSVSLRRRFDAAFALVSWANLSPNRRRGQALQSDFLHDLDCMARSERIFRLSNALLEEQKKGVPDQRLIRDLQQQIVVADACQIREAIERWKLSAENKAFIAVAFLSNFKEEGNWEVLLQAQTNSPVSIAPAPQPAARQRRPADSTIQKWYAARVQSWTGTPPTEKEDLTAARQELSGGVRRSQVRTVRKSTPDHWRKRGPRNQ